MHEWSVADSIVRTVINWADDNKIKSIRKIKIGIPSFSFLELDILKEAFNVLKKGTILDSATLEVIVKEPTFICKNCEYVFTAKEVQNQLDLIKSEFGEEYPLHLMPALAPSFIKCPKCGSHDIIVKEEDITIEEVEVGENETAQTVS